MRRYIFYTVYSTDVHIYTYKRVNKFCFCFICDFHASLGPCLNTHILYYLRSFRIALRANFDLTSIRYREIKKENKYFKE